MGKAESGKGGNFMHWCLSERLKIYKLGIVERHVFIVLIAVLLIAVISGCAGTGKLDIGGEKVDYANIEVYSSEIPKKIHKTSQNYEKGKVHKALVGEPLIAKIKGYVVKCKALNSTHAGQYVTQNGNKYNIKYEDVDENGYYVHVDCEGNYSDCGVGYYKIDDDGSLLSIHPYYDYYGEWYVVNELSIKDASNQTVEKETKLFDLLISITYSKDAYKTELVYSGVNDNNVQLIHKKYTSYLTKPSSQQDLSYTINEKNKIVNFRDYEIKIVEATNQYVKYVVLSD